MDLDLETKFKHILYEMENQSGEKRWPNVNTLPPQRTKLEAKGDTWKTKAERSENRHQTPERRKVGDKWTETNYTSVHRHQSWDTPLAMRTPTVSGWGKTYLRVNKKDNYKYPLLQLTRLNLSIFVPVEQCRRHLHFPGEPHWDSTLESLDLNQRHQTEALQRPNDSKKSCQPVKFLRWVLKRAPQSWDGLNFFLRVGWVGFSTAHLSIRPSRCILFCSHFLIHFLILSNFTLKCVQCPTQTLKFKKSGMFLCWLPASSTSSSLIGSYRQTANRILRCNSCRLWRPPWLPAFGVPLRLAFPAHTPTNPSELAEIQTHN